MFGAAARCPPDPPQERFLVVMEKVARFSGWLAWDEIGRIVAYDQDMLALCGYGKVCRRSSVAVLTASEPVAGAEARLGVARVGRFYAG